MQYRELRNYKYLVMEDYSVQTNIKPANDLVFRFMELSTTGVLIVRKSYAWDGATAFPITPNTMLRGSLVHDALYQLMQLRALDYKKDRILADKMLKQLCLEDGMLFFEAVLVYNAVRLFGASHAKPKLAVEVEVLEAP